MNRRLFLRILSAVAALPMIGLVACKAAQTTIAAIITTIGTGLSLALTSAGQPAIASQVSQWAQTAANAVKNWVSGTPGQEVIEALNLFIANIGTLTGTGTLLSIIQNAVTTVEGLLADFGVTAATVASAVAAHATIQATWTGKSPSQGTLNAVLADFKANHNRLAQADPAFASAVLK